MEGKITTKRFLPKSPCKSKFLCRKPQKQCRIDVVEQKSVGRTLMKKLLPVLEGKELQDREKWNFEQFLAVLTDQSFNVMNIKNTY